MWIFKYLVCLMRNHCFINIAREAHCYQLCLRCGKVEAQDSVGLPIPSLSIDN
ncbi:hypothetical protein ES703_77884 [subsurface metagenome]